MSTGNTTVIVLLLGMLLIAEPRAGSQETVPTEAPITEQEAARLANALIAGFEKTGDIRKVDRNLFHRSFLETVCLAPREICVQISKDDAREFTYTLLNILWLVFEHQLSMPNPVWLGSNALDNPDQFINDLLPEEGRDVMKTELRTCMLEMKTITDYHKSMDSCSAIEKRLLQERVSHDHVNQPSYHKNLQMMDEKTGSVGGHSRFSAVDAKVGGGMVPENTYLYVKIPFFLFVTKEQSKPKIVLILPMNE